MTRIKIYGLFLLSSLQIAACNKKWLDEKTDISLTVPSRIEDFQALLDDDYRINFNQGSDLEIASGDFYMLDSRVMAVSPSERGVYLWEPDTYMGDNVARDWGLLYSRLLTINIAVEGIDNIKPDEGQQAAWNNVKGSGLFYRAINFFQLSQMYCMPYNQETADHEPGIPLRTRSDINELSVRSTLRETYDQIVNELLMAKELLPVTTIYKTRPTKAAAYAALARIYLSMSRYEDALIYADMALEQQHTLIDFNTLDSTSAYPLPMLNDEIIFQSTLNNTGTLFPSSMIVDSVLYRSYHDDDLRKPNFFLPVQSGYAFKGSYQGSRLCFNGLTTSEMLLISAECRARKGERDVAMSRLNTLLEKRWRTPRFVPQTAPSADDALVKILAERRKELCFRGLRWSALRRLNQEPRFAVTLTRKFEGKTYQLPPNDRRYAFLIPYDVIRLTGMEQNTR